MNESSIDDVVVPVADPYTGNNPSASYYVFQAILLAFVMVITVLGNVAVCYVVYRTRSITTVTGMCITSLAVADLLRGGLILPFIVVASASVGSWQLSGVACSLLGMGYTLFGSASVMTLAAVSVDRYFAILRPLQYTTIVTVWRATIFLCIIWGVSFVMALLPVIGWSEYIFIPWNAVCIPNWHSYKSYAFFYLTISFIIPFSILVFCYYKIFVVARHQSRRVMSMEATSREAFNITSAGTPAQTRPKQRLVMRKEKKAAMTLFAVMGVFIMCVTPYCIVHLVYAFLATQNLLIALGLTSMLSFINSAANPLIYGILNRKFRRVFVEVMKCYYCPCWANGPISGSGADDYVSDAYNTGASGRRKPILPRDSGCVMSVTPQTASNKPVRKQDIFSISVAASSINTMAALGTVVQDLPRLVVYTSQLQVIDNLPSAKCDNGNMKYVVKQRTSPVKSVTFSNFDQETGPTTVGKNAQRSISESSDSGNYKLEKLLPVNPNALDEKITKHQTTISVSAEV